MDLLQSHFLIATTRKRITMSFSEENLNSFFAWANVQHIEFELKQLFETKERILSNTPIGERWAMEQYLSGFISEYMNTRFRK